MEVVRLQLLEGGMNRRFIFAIGFPVIVGGLWLHSQLRSHAQFQFIDAPASWVAFDAAFQETSPMGRLTITGHCYRASDGSTREEWDVGGRGTVLITIQSIANSTFYALRQANKGVWEQHPMVLPRDGHRPLLMREDTEGLTPVGDQIEGLSLYRYGRMTSSIVQLQSPELNFFPLVIQNVNGGSRLVYYNIKRREQPQELFLPPPDASIVLRSNPMGIVAVAPGEKSPLEVPVGQ